MKIVNSSGQTVFEIDTMTGDVIAGAQNLAQPGGPHTHEQDDIDGLEAALAGKSDVGHTHDGGGNLPETISFGGYLALTNVGANYDTTAQAKGLGIGVIDFTGVASIDFRVYVNKVGTGTQSWQLWNVTDGSEIGVIADAGAAGERVLSGSINTNLPTGTKVVRIRAKSTVAGDDPVFYGASIKLS